MSVRRLLRVAETLLIAACGGLLMEFAGLPAGLVSGAVLAVAAAALLGRPMTVPPPLTRLVLVIIGIALGSVVTPATIGGVTAYPASVAMLAGATLATMTATAFYLRRVHGWGRLSAVLGGSPGAMSQVMALSAENDVNIPAVMVVQTIRVTILAAGLPLGLSLLGLVRPAPVVAAPSAAPLGPAQGVELLVLVALAAGFAYALVRLRFPGGWVFGAMAASALLHGSGWTTALLPAPVVSAAMVAVGAVTGSRFAGTPLRLLSTYLAAGLGSFAVSALVAALFMVAAVELEPRPAEIAIAFAPGAQETMMLLALALRLDPVFVGTHHIARFVVVSVAVAILATVIIRRSKGP